MSEHIAMGQSVKRKYTLKHLPGNNVNLIKILLPTLGSCYFKMRLIFRESIGMQARNKQITRDD